MSNQRIEIGRVEASWPDRFGCSNPLTKLGFSRALFVGSHRFSVITPSQIAGNCDRLSAWVKEGGNDGSWRSVRTRFSNRKPQSHAYAPLSPVLHYNPGQGDLVGVAKRDPAGMTLAHDVGLNIRSFR